MSCESAVRLLGLTAIDDRAPDACCRALYSNPGCHAYWQAHPASPSAMGGADSARLMTVVRWRKGWSSASTCSHDDPGHVIVSHGPGSPARQRNPLLFGTGW